jgi:hypothetical protein
MGILTCTECKHDFEVQFPFGDDVTCSHCKVVLETDWDGVGDSLYAWVVGKAKDGLANDSKERDAQGGGSSQPDTTKGGDTII